MNIWTCKDGNIRRVRYNNELYQLFKEPDVVKEVKSRRLRWLGHLFRVGVQYPYKKITFSNRLQVGNWTPIK